jgi:hypothetical protein
VELNIKFMEFQKIGIHQGKNTHTKEEVDKS